LVVKRFFDGWSYVTLHVNTLSDAAIMLKFICTGSWAVYCEYLFCNVSHCVTACMVVTCHWTSCVCVLAGY